MLEHSQQTPLRQTTEPSFSDAEANASTNITPAMQSRIDAGITKRLALALKPGQQKLLFQFRPPFAHIKGYYFGFAHLENKSCSTEDCEFLKSKGFSRQLTKEMFQIKQLVLFRKLSG